MSAMAKALQVPSLSRAHWHGYLAEVRFELLRAFRSPGFVVPTTVLPNLLYLLFTCGIVEASREPSIQRYILAGFAVMAAMGPALFAFGVFMATDRAQGLADLKYAAGMPAGAGLVAKWMLVSSLSALVGGTLALLATLVGGVSMSATQMSHLVVTVALGATPFCALGIGIGSYANSRAAAALANSAFLAMVYLSGILIPLPATLKPLQAALPPHHLEQLVLIALGDAAEGSWLAHATFLGVTTLTCCALTLSLSRRRQRG